MKTKEHQQSRLEFEEESRRKLWTIIRNTNTYLLHSFNHNMLREQVLAEMSGLRADMEAWSLSHSESEKEFVEAMKMEKKENKEAISLQKQLEQIQKLQKGEQNKESEWEQEQLQIKTAEKEIKIRLAEQEKDMENYQDYVWEEERLQRFTKENSEIEKASVQEIQLKIQCVTDDSRRKEDELSKLQASSQSADYTELYELFYKVEEVHEMGCVICLRNEPTYILLPCGHKILCEICANANIMGKMCPDCDVEIKGSLRVFGPTS